MARYYQDMAAAKDAGVTHAPAASPQGFTIKVTVERCQDLKVHYPSSAEIAPFYYYQFYTFEDFISME